MGWKGAKIAVGVTVATGLVGAGLSGAAVAQKRSAPARPTAAPARAAAPQVGPITGPIATYWMSAATTSGFGAGMMGGGGGRPDMGSILAMATGRGPSPDAANHSLTLQLGSTQSAADPQAEHRPPVGLGVGPSLPLVTPQPARQTASAPSSEPGDPESYQRPKGRILIFWGCGEHAGPGQPVVFDFSTLGTGAPLPDLGGGVKVNAERPPAYGRTTTYGHWPNERRSPPVPATGSLVGPHSVKSDYAPDIAFDVPPDLDFMPALGMAVSGATPEGGKRITWNPAATATGYYLQMMGAQGSRGGGPGGASGGGADIVFWASSSVKPGFFGGGLADYLPPEEVRRLVAQGAVLPPDRAECVVPVEVAQAAPMGLVTGIAYGPERTFVDPPRPTSGPWPIRWQAKVRVKSTATLLLGMQDAMNGRSGGRSGGRPSDRDEPPPPPPSAGDRARSILKNLRPF